MKYAYNFFTKDNAFLKKIKERKCRFKEKPSLWVLRRLLTRIGE